MVMSKELKEKWVEKLRSGEVKQGTGKLCREKTTGPEYCCLGVLCEIVGMTYSMRQTSLDSLPSRVYTDSVTGNIDRHYVPEGEYSEMLIFTDPNEDYITFASQLAWLNDNGLDFLDIAAYIEANLEAV